MSYPVYYVPAGDVLPVFFSTYDGGTGASITMTGLAVTDVEIFKDSSMTQRASDAGITLLDTDGIDLDLITGIHGFSIDTGDDTDAGFYAVGSWFHVVVSAITVDAQTVNFIACAFRIMAAESVAGKPKVDVDAWLGTAAATPTVAGVPEVDLTHVAGATTNVSALATNVDAILTDTADMQPKLGTPAGASISADIAAIEAQTDDIGAAGAGLTAVPWNAAWDAEVQSEVDDALVAQRLDELVNADSDIDGLAPPTVGSVIHELMSKTAGSFTYDQTTDSLEAIRDKETDIETDTAEIGAAGAGLTNINLPDQTMNITGDITGNLSGSVGSVTGAVGSVTGAVGSVTGAVGSVTGAVGSVTAGVTVATGGIGSGDIAAAELNNIADAVLDRVMSAGTDSGADNTSARTVRQALRVLRNKYAIAAGTGTCYKEDDTTASFTEAITTTAGNPISSKDPV